MLPRYWQIIASRSCWMKFNELNGVEIDCNRNVGIINIIKKYVSLTYDKSLIALNAGWNIRSDTEEGHFNFCVPLNMLLSFCEDYKHVIVNARHELILIISRNNNNYRLEIRWQTRCLNYSKCSGKCRTLLSEINNLSMLRILESNRYQHEFSIICLICTNIFCYEI